MTKSAPISYPLVATGGMPRRETGLDPWPVFMVISFAAMDAGWSANGAGEPEGHALQQYPARYGSPACLVAGRQRRAIGLVERGARVRRGARDADKPTPFDHRPPGKPKGEG